MPNTPCLVNEGIVFWQVLDQNDHELK